MKKTLFTLGLAIAATLTLTNCAKQEAIIKDAEPAKQGVPFELVAGMDTKTEATDAGVVTWKTGDALAVFHAEAGSTTYSKNDKFTFDSGSSFKGELQDGALTADAYDWYALYPYDSHIKTPGEKASGYSELLNNQTQTGNNSKAHLAGAGMLLYGKATNVAKGTKPSIAMKQANSVVRVHITNKTESPLTVTSVSFTAPVSIIGNFYVNFVGDNVVFSDASGAVKTATLNVSEGAAIAKDASADFYIPIKPFNVAEGTLSVTINEECTKSFIVSSAVAFAEGTIKTVNVNYTGVDVVVPKTLPYENTLISGHTDFSIENVSKGGLDAVWADNSAGITANAYKATSDIEAYLISPVFDLSTAPSAFLEFEHNVRYFSNLETAKVQASLQVKVDDGTWTAVTIPDYSTNSNNDFVFTSIDLSAYCGHELRFRFKFLSTHSPKSEGRWEIKNINFKTTPTATLKVTPTALNWAADETDAKTVTVTVNGSATGYTVTPASDANFTISDNGSGTITVTPKAANTSTTDAKSLVLTITHKDDGELTETVTCTQAKASTAGTSTVTLTGTNMSNMTGGNAYGNEKTGTFGGFDWSSNGYRTNDLMNMLQLRVRTNSKGVSYIQLPTFPGNIQSVSMNVTDTNATAYSTSSNLCTATLAIQSGKSKDETVLVSGSATGNVISLDLSAKSVTTGYIVSTYNSARIWEITVVYNNN